MINWVALSVFIFFFLLVTVLGFVASRWRRGDLDLLNEWGLAGRRFGTVVTWFLLGGDLYTAYTFIAVPAAMYGLGALNGFFAVPYTILVYPLIFLIMPRFWTVCKQRGYVTASDFVKDRFGSSSLALAVAFTGILATLPYIALQMFGIQVSLAALGIPLSIPIFGVNVDIPLIIAFIILAAYTYTSGLRAPAMIALVKDLMIFIVLFLYPHALTGVLSSNCQKVVKRNTALLPIYSLMLGLLALTGYMAIAANVKPLPGFGSNGAVLRLINAFFPSWFAGFAFAVIAM